MAAKRTLSRFVIGLITQAGDAVMIRSSSRFCFKYQSAILCWFLSQNFSIFPSRSRTFPRKLKNFRIIHGDGTGRLRKAVHEKLRNDPSVKEFRLGMPQEGGTGATVVELK